MEKLTESRYEDMALSKLSENELSKIVIDCCFKIFKTLGPGLLESVYEELMCYELFKSGLKFTRQQGIPVIYGGVIMELGFRADIIVEEKVIIEIKSVAAINPVHTKQVLTYLRVTGLKLGLLINFNEALLKNGIHRVVNNL